MSKDNKNRFIALLLGIIICLNVVFMSPRKTEAFGIGEAIALRQALQSFGIGAVMAAGQSDECYAATDSIIDDFINFYYQNYPDDWDEWGIIDQELYVMEHPISAPTGTVWSVTNAAINGVNVPSFLLKSAYNAFNDYLVNNFLNSDTGSLEYTSVSSDLPSVNYNNLLSAVKAFADNYYNADLNSGTMDWFMQRCHTSSGTPRYFYIYDMAWPDGNNHNKLCLISSSVQNPTFFYDSGFRCFNGVRATYIDLDGALRDNYWCGNGVTDDEAVLLTSFYFDPALSDDYVATSTTDISVRDDFINDRVNLLNDYVDDHSATVVTHAADGSETSERQTVVSVPMKQVEDDDGNTTWEPLTQQEIRDSGLDVSSLVSAPSEVEKYQTADNSQSVGGTVSVTGFARFVENMQTSGFWVALVKALTGLLVRVDGFASFVSDFQSVKDVFTIPGFAALVGDFVDVLTELEIADLFSYPGLLRNIAAAIPTVIDYTSGLNGIKQAILGLDIPAVNDYTSILNGINSGILGISIPTPIDYTNILNGILSGVGSISIPIPGDYSDVLDSILAGVTGISIPSFPDIGDILESVFLPDLTNIINLKPQFERKFAFAEQLRDLWDVLLEGQVATAKIEFTFELPAFFHTPPVTCKIIDFQTFDQYRQWFHYLVILFAWLSFAKRCYYSVPTLLGYVGGSVAERKPPVIINNVRNSYNRYDYI